MGLSAKTDRALHGAVSLALILATSLLLASPAVAQTTKPNIVFILVDNVGWGDFGCYGG